MPRVLRIINRLNLGGPTYNVAYLTKFLEPQFETLLVSGMKDDTEESSEFILNKYGIKPVYIPEMKREIDWKNDRLAYKKIKQLITDFKPDIVHTHAAKSGAIGRLAAYYSNVPIVLHTFHGHVFHSYFSPIKTRFFIETERYLAKKSTKIIAISDVQKEELTNTYKICQPNQMEVVPLGFDLDRFQQNTKEKRQQFRAKYLLDDDEIAISIIGRLVPVKNHSFFIEVAKWILQITTKKVRFLIIGDGESRTQVESDLQQAGLDYTDALKENRKATVVLTSWIKEIDVAIAGSDIIAMTSLNEGTPVSLIEAQAGNKPIISTRVGGIENVVSDQTGFLCPVNDIGYYTQQLLQLIENDPLRQRLAANGWAFVNEKFSYRRLCSDMSNLYNRLLNQKNINL